MTWEEKQQLQEVSTNGWEETKWKNELQAGPPMCPRTENTRQKLRGERENITEMRTSKGKASQSQNVDSLECFPTEEENKRKIKSLPGQNKH